MSPLAEKLYELIQLLPADDREELLKKIQNGSGMQQSAPRTEKTASDLPSFSGGKWLGGTLGRHERDSTNLRKQDMTL